MKCSWLWGDLEFLLQNRKCSSKMQHPYSSPGADRVSSQKVREGTGIMWERLRPQFRAFVTFLIFKTHYLLFLTCVTAFWIYKRGSNLREYHFIDRSAMEYKAEDRSCSFLSCAVTWGPSQGTKGCGWEGALWLFFTVKSAPFSSIKAHSYLNVPEEWEQA